MLVGERIMVRRCGSIGLLIAVAGCLPLQLADEPKTATVSSNPFGLQAPHRSVKVAYQPADEAMATRVDGIARKLLAENPQIGLRSTLFATIGGSPQPEIFHTGPHMVYVTDGLVRRCSSDAELAAALALELGKIVSEREAGASPDMRSPDRLPPMQVPVGKSGQFTSPDLIHEVELAKFEVERPRTRRPLPRPDPQQLARGYLEKAGYQSSDLDSAQPLLRAAQNNITLERQFKGMAAGGWTP
jgi:hypothetical protein